jgi:hypothetical protein
MEDPPSPAPPQDRIEQAWARVNAAMARVSQAQEILTEAKERLALARLALKEGRAQGADDRVADDPTTKRDPMNGP